MDCRTKFLLPFILTTLGIAAAGKSIADGPSLDNTTDFTCLETEVKFQLAENPFPSCVELLSTSPCDDPVASLVKDKITGEGVCKRLDTETCSRSKEIRYTIFGDPVCSCRKGLLYFESSDECYPPYERGPCLEDEYLFFHEEKGSYEVKCEKNRCQPNEIYADTSLIHKSGSGPVYECINPANGTLCPKGKVIQIDSDSLKHRCSSVRVFLIFYGLGSTYPMFGGPSKKSSWPVCNKISIQVTHPIGYW